MTVAGRGWILGLGCVVLLAAGVAWAADDKDTPQNTILPSDHPAIAYADATVNDPGARLNERLEAGEARLEYREGHGYLSSLLEQLGVNSDSQMLVFSKTSFQASRISPRAPRAIYFNDNVTIGSVQESDVLELATLDPRQGYIFYTFDNKKSEAPRLDRRDVCLQCHHGPATAGVPGIMIASVYPDSSGMPFARLGMPVTDHRTRFNDRWGGWYVTGTHGGMLHRGNAVARDRKYPDLLDTRDTQNVTDLAKKFDVSLYLQPGSDLVALMTLEHQTRMTNLITRLGWEERIAQKDGGPEPNVEPLIRYMLFADEAVLLDTIEGTSTFAKTFPQRAPRDRKGRGLRDFDLQKRMFRYPLSYMIYSEAFDALPDRARDRVYRRLGEVLRGEDAEKFVKLSADDRRNILEILLDTKPNLPAEWRKSLAAAMLTGG
jgi:hypothetical protein